MTGKILLAAYCFMLFTEKVKAVNDTIPASQKINHKEQSLHFGVTGMKFAVKDYSTSPLIYSGLLVGGRLGASFYGKRVVTLIDCNFSYGKLTTRNYPVTDSNKATAYNSFLSVNMGRRISCPEAKTSWYGGIHLNILANFRNNDKFDNASFNYEGFISLGPMVLLEKEINLFPSQLNLGIFRWPFRARTIKLSASLAIPVLNEVVRPLYNTTEDFVDEDSPSFTLNRLKTVSFGKLFSLISQTNLSYYLHNGNKFMLSYSWYYYNYYPEWNKLRNVAGCLSFSFVFKLNK
jgi:hypothetical protein